MPRRPGGRTGRLRPEAEVAGVAAVAEVVPAPSSAAAAAPAATPSIPLLLRRWVSSGSWSLLVRAVRRERIKRLMPGTPRGRRALSVSSASLVVSQKRLIGGD